jgi:hypothetical protein
MNLKDLLQLCLLGRRTGTLHVNHPDGDRPFGHVHLQDGRIVHAQTPTQSGEDAFFSLLAAPSSPVRFVEELPGPPHTISTDPNFLLMEAARRQDIRDSTPLGQSEPGDPSASAAPCLFVLSEITPRTLPLGPSTFTIGRHISCSLRLENSTVSQHHASVVFEDNAHFLRDEGSTNGTFLNSKPVWDTAPLKEGDIIRVGAVLIRFHTQHTAAGVPRADDPGRHFTLPPQGPPRFPPHAKPPGALAGAPTAHAS